MVKKLTITKIKTQLWKLVSIYIKTRDNNTCWHCGATTNLHCSHILAKGNTQYPKYEFCSWNLKTLCLHCHLNWWHKCPLQAAQWLQQSFPEVYAKAMEMAKPDIYAAYPKQTPEELLKLKLKLENTF